MKYKVTEDFRKKMNSMYKEFTENFRQKMERELDANTLRKGNFMCWTPWNQNEVYDEAVRHMYKLLDAIQLEEKAKVSEYAADVANFMAKIDDLYGEK